MLRISKAFAGSKEIKAYLALKALDHSQTELLSKEDMANGKASEGLKDHIASQWLSRRRLKSALILFLKC